MRHLLWVVALALASMTLFACQSIPFMGPGCLVLTVRGIELEDVVSIYLIVGDEVDLADLANEKTIDRVVLPPQQQKYVAFGQYKPRHGKSWTLEQLLLKTDQEVVGVAVSKKAPNLEVEIHRELLDARPTLAAVIVVNCRSSGWGASEVIKSSVIRNIDDMELDLRGTRITVHDKSSGSMALPTGVPE